MSVTPKQTVQELMQLQALPLDAKIAKTKQRIYEWYTHFNGQVYVGFSGGKDSTVLLHLVRSEYPDVPAVYSRTPDYPDVAKFATSQDNVTVVNPKMPFHQIVREYGYPVISKEVSECIHYARRDRGGVYVNPSSQEISVSITNTSPIAPQSLKKNKPS